MPKDTSSPEYQTLKTEIRAVLISSQQGCTERELVKDYAAFNTSSEIPFRAMGYSSLMELLSSMPDVARIDHRRSPPIIMGVSDDSTRHIQQLVLQQKKNKKQVQKRNLYNQRVYAPMQYPPQPPLRQFATPNYFNALFPPASAYSITRPTFPSYPTQQVLTNSQQLNQSFSDATKSSTAKAVASFPPKGLSPSDLQASRLTPTHDDNSSTTDEDGKQLDDDPWAVYDYKHAETYGDAIIFLRQRIRQLLLKFRNGCWLTSVGKLYKNFFREEFKLEDFHLKNLLTFFDCISDFVDSQRVKTDEHDRLIKLKENLVELVKKEPTPDASLTKFLSNRNLNIDQQLTAETEDLDRMPATDADELMQIDRPKFVSADFRYKRADCRTSEIFKGFLGDAEDPWSLTIGYARFMSVRDTLTTELQAHYARVYDQPAYVVPYDKLKLNLACVYYHYDQQYYRAFIEFMDEKSSNGSRIIQMRLVDYGVTVDNISYYPQSTFLKFLHEDFAHVATEIYDCRLANLELPPGKETWPVEAKKMIFNYCKDRTFDVEVTEILDTMLCVNLWLDENCQQSINHILAENGLAISTKDNTSSEFQQFHHPVHHYIDPRLLADSAPHQTDYSAEERWFKRFIISIEHAYYLVKQPFTKRPCLPCFELAHLLDIDENSLHEIDIVRTKEIRFNDSPRDLFDGLRNLEESYHCPHLHRNDSEASVILYDLQGVRDYLTKVRLFDGDVLDAFTHEYQSFSRLGYWNEAESVYMREQNIDASEEFLADRKKLLNYRRAQLSSSSADPLDAFHNEETRDIDGRIQDVDQRLKNIYDIRHPKSMELSSSSSPVRSVSSMQNKSSKSKLRETLLRLARPFDRHFGLNVCFNHQPLNESHLNGDVDELDECLRDLHRIMDNVLQFFRLERDILHPEDRLFFDDLTNRLPELIDSDSWQRRIELYNHCLEVIELCHPTIRGYIQRIDLIDSI